MKQFLACFIIFGFAMVSLQGQPLSGTLTMNNPPADVAAWPGNPECLELSIESYLTQPEPVRLSFELHSNGLPLIVSSPASTNMVTLTPGINLFSASDLISPTGISYVGLAPGSALSEGNYEMCINIIPMSTSVPPSELICDGFQIIANPETTNPTTPVTILLNHPADGAAFKPMDIEPMFLRWEQTTTLSPASGKHLILSIYPLEWWQSPAEAINNNLPLVEEEVTGLFSIGITHNLFNTPGKYAWTVFEASTYPAFEYESFADPFVFEVTIPVESVSSGCVPCFFPDAIFLLPKDYCQELKGESTPQTLTEIEPGSSNITSFEGFEMHPFGSDEKAKPKIGPPLMIPGEYRWGEIAYSGEGPVVTKISNYQVVQSSYAVSALSHAEEALLESENIDAITDSLKAVRERLRRNEAAEERAHRAAHSNNTRAENAEKLLRETNDKIRKLDSVIAGYKTQLATLYAIDQRLEAMEGLHREKMESLAAQAIKLEKGRKVKKDLNRAVDDAKKALDDCLDALAQLQAQLNLLQQQKQAIQDQQDPLLAELDAMYKADGWVGGVGRRPEGTAKFGWAGCANCPGEPPPRIAWGNPEYTAATNLANQVRQMNRQIRNLNAQIAQVQNQLAQRDCSEFERRLAEAEAALAEANKLKQIQSELAHECHLIKEQLLTLQAFCHQHPNQCQNDLIRHLQYLLDNCPPPGKNHRVYWDNFNRLIAEKKQRESLIKVKIAQDSVRLSIERKKRKEHEATRDMALDETNNSQTEANGLAGQNAHDRAWRDALAEKQKELQEEEEQKRWAAKFLNNDPPLEEPQNIRGGNTNLWIGLYEAMASHIRDMILKSGGCKQECLKAISTMLVDKSVGGAFADLIIQAVGLDNLMRSVRDFLIKKLTKLATWKVKALMAALEAGFNKYLESGQEIKMMTQDYQTEINGNPFSLHANGFYYPGTGSVHWYITCDKCQPPVTYFIKYRVNEHGRAISNPLIYQVD